MKLKKRKKHSRMRGRRTHGFSAKLHKGKGSQGGKGMSGTGKRADQKKSFVIKKLYPYFGKRGFTSRKTEKKRVFIVNLKEIESRHKPGEVDLKNYKILGEGEIKGKYILHAMAASRGAVEKVKKAGGQIILVKDKKREQKNSE